MISLLFKSREKKEISNDFVLAVLYGPGIKSNSVMVELSKFEKIYKEIGGSSLIMLESSDNDKEKKYKVLIHDVQRDPLSGKITHVDFYQPNLKEEVEVEIPLIFEGEPPAVKELGGTLVKNISELMVKSLPEKLPHNIKVNVESLKTFDDTIMIKDLKLPEGVEILKDPEEIIALVTPIEETEEELNKPIEEDVDSVETIKKGKKEEEAEDKDNK
jgi:large subunit ribosomal protein L25